MPSIRIFERDLLRVWLVDEGGQRELRDPIGHLPGKIDWNQTIANCRALGKEGMEIDLVFEAEPGE